MWSRTAEIPRCLWYERDIFNPHINIRRNRRKTLLCSSGLGSSLTICLSSIMTTNTPISLFNHTAILLAFQLQQTGIVDTGTGADPAHYGHHGAELPDPIDSSLRNNSEADAAVAMQNFHLQEIFLLRWQSSGRKCSAACKSRCRPPRQQPMRTESMLDRHWCPSVPNAACQGHRGLFKKQSQMQVDWFAVVWLGFGLFGFVLLLGFCGGRGGIFFFFKDTERR